MLESVFPLAPLLLAPLVRWRRAAIVGVIAVLLIVPMQRARGEILTPLPDWQTWSMQDIGARAADCRRRSRVGVVGAGDADRPRARSGDARVAAGSLRARTVRRDRRWGRGEFVLIVHACLLLGATHVLWLYNDRYYLVFAPGIVVLGGRARSTTTRARSGSRRPSSSCGPRSASPARAICWPSTRRARWRPNSSRPSGVPPWEIDAGYPLNGWRLYAHSENLPPGADRRYDVPFVTSDRKAQYVIENYPPAGANIVRSFRCRERPGKRRASCTS